MRFWNLAAVGLLVVLVGCGAPTLDGSSEEALSASLERIPEAEQQEVAVAVMHLMMPCDADSIKRALMIVDGKTGAEVIAASDSLATSTVFEGAVESARAEVMALKARNDAKELELRRAGIEIPKDY